MIAETPTIADQAETIIRDRIGEFMQARAMIEKLRRSSNLDIQNKANVLAQRQRDLEVQLDKNLKVIDDAKKGVWTVGGLLALSTFAAAMLTHTKEVKALAAGQPIAVGGEGTSTPVKLGLIGLGALAVYMLWR